MRFVRFGFMLSVVMGMLVWSACAGNATVRKGTQVNYDACSVATGTVVNVTMCKGSTPFSQDCNPKECAAGDSDVAETCRCPAAAGGVAQCWDGIKCVVPAVDLRTCTRVETNCAAYTTSASCGTGAGVNACKWDATLATPACVNDDKCAAKKTKAECDVLGDGCTWK